MVYFRAVRMLLLICIILVSAVAVSAQCPTLTVRGPAGITSPGDEMTFRAEVNVIGPKVSYSWSVDNGTIIEGQGTPEITVVTTRELAGEAVRAKVEIEGLPLNCERTASETAGIAEVIACGLPADEWGEMKPNDERGRLDLFFAELANNPDQVGLIVFKVKAGDRLDPSNNRIQFFLKHVKFRKFDKSRIWFALEVSDRRSTTLYRMPPDVEPPCSECLIFRGESL